MHTDTHAQTLKSTIETLLTSFDAIRFFEVFFSLFAAASKYPG